MDACYFGKLVILNGVVQHSGDNLTGEGGGDDEVITVHLGDLPPQVTGLVFTVNSFSGQKFTEVAKAYCRLIDAGTGPGAGPLRPHQRGAAHGRADVQAGARSSPASGT